MKCFQNLLRSSSSQIMQDKEIKQIHSNISLYRLKSGKNKKASPLQILPYCFSRKESPAKKQSMAKALLLTLKLSVCMKQAQAMNCETTQYKNLEQPGVVQKKFMSLFASVQGAEGAVLIPYQELFFMQKPYFPSTHRKRDQSKIFDLNNQHLLQSYFPQKSEIMGYSPF